MNKPHPHAALLGMYAQDAQRHDRPWELWQIKKSDGNWRDCNAPLLFLEEHDYRQKPVVIVVNGVEIPEPNYSVVPGRNCWIVDILADDAWEASTVARFDQIRTLAKRGLVHYTYEAAHKHRAALLSFSEKK